MNDNAVSGNVTEILLNIGATSYGALGHVPPPWSLRMYTNLASSIYTCMYLQWAVKSQRSKVKEIIVLSGQWWTSSE